MIDYYRPLRFAIVYTPRSGSTFLAHCLDGHPQVSCERDSPLDDGNHWRRWGQIDNGVAATERSLLRALWERSGYLTAGFKLSYRQARRVNVEWLADGCDERVIHLHRPNAVRAVVSSMINTLVRDGGIDHPYHTYVPVKPAAVRLDPAQVVSGCRHYADNVDAMLEELRGLCGDKLLSLTYDQLVGGEDNEAIWLDTNLAFLLCDWLGVTQRHLCCDLRKVNAGPLDGIVSNWDDVRAALANDGEFGQWL